MTSSNCFVSLVLVGCMAQAGDTVVPPASEPAPMDNALMPSYADTGLHADITQQSQQVDQLNNETLEILQMIRRKKGLLPPVVEAPAPVVVTSPPPDPEIAPLE